MRGPLAQHVENASMKNALKLFVMGLAVVSLLASCKKNNNTEVPKEGFAASIEQNGDSKTFLDGLVVKWSAYDQIKVNNGTRTLTYELTNGAGSTDGTFYTGEEHSTFFDPSNHYTAVYPAANPANSSETNTIAGTEATVHLPATQNILANGSFGVGYNPMVAYSSSQTLSFKNLCGALRFQMVGAGIIVKTIELTTGDPDDYLSGTFTVVCSSANPVLTPPTSSVSGNNTITLTCPDSGIELSGTTATNFYFMLPPGTLHGLTLTAKNGSGETVYTETSTKNFTITRNNIIPVNELEVPLNVTTTSPFNITTSSAKAGGTVGNGTPAEWGVLYSSTTTDPKEGNEGVTKVNMTSGTAYSGYSGSMSLPADNTTYYARAYAKSAKGTYYYGDVIPFATRPTYTNGQMPGEFSVSASQNVYFSMGNLQWSAYGGGGDVSTTHAVHNGTDEDTADGTWRFASNQYDFIGSDNSNISSTYSGWIDLFGRGTSGFNNYNPDMNSTAYNDYCMMNFYTGQHVNYDWGFYNAISNGGTYRVWRTLSSAEWSYLVDNHVWALVQLTSIEGVSGNNINGLIVLPNGMTWPLWPSEIADIDCNSGISSYQSNLLTEAQWSLLERDGAVFLPTAGYRLGTSVESLESGWYWTSTYAPGAGGKGMVFSVSGVDPASTQPVQRGFSVRVVKDV